MRVRFGNWELRIDSGWGIPKIALGMTGLRENVGGEDGIEKTPCEPSEQHFAKYLAWENADIWWHHHWFHQFEGKPVQCSLFSITFPQVAANVWRRHQIWFSFSVSMVYLNLNLIWKGSLLNPINNEIVLAIRASDEIWIHHTKITTWTMEISSKLYITLGHNVAYLMYDA